MYAFVLFPSILNTLSQETCFFYNIFLPIVNVFHLRGLWGLDNVLVIKREAAGKLNDFVLQTLCRFCSNFFGDPRVFSI